MSTDYQDLALDTQTHDLPEGGLSFVMASGDERVAQQLRIRLRFFLGEWFLDTTEGIPYYQQILLKNPDWDTVNSLIKTEVLSTPDVVELLSFKTEYAPYTRRYNIPFLVQTTYGVLEFEESF